MVHTHDSQRASYGFLKYIWSLNRAGKRDYKKTRHGHPLHLFGSAHDSTIIQGGIKQTAIIVILRPDIYTITKEVQTPFTTHQFSCPI